MNDKYYVLTQNEFLVMLLLTGGNGGTVGIRAESVDAETLTTALMSLFSRGFISRNGRGFAPKGEGELFYEISSSKCAVVLSSSVGRMAICYVCTECIWFCELVREGFRIKKCVFKELWQWLFDSGVLEWPLLHDEDAEELRTLCAEEPAFTDKDCFLMFEKYANGGVLLERHKIVRIGATIRIISSIGNIRNVEISTQEALRRMLANAFDLKYTD